ncbi:intercellular adhesion molecule 5-like [Rhea pennata]|uniref:intercellular adhesion molecule 5-like n=1 Tax=Rhea pennata TaxID=8795 RepID=UPI002E2759EB
MRPSALLLVLCALCALAGRPHASFEVSIEPAAPVVEYGGSIRLTCKTTCPDSNTVGDLETSIRKHNVQFGPGQTSVELSNVTEWHSRVLCFYKCASVRKTVSVELVAYRAPEQPQLELEQWLEEGKSHNVTCSVPSVAPVRNLTVTLGQGAETLHTQTFEHDTRPSPQQVLVTHKITAQRWHHGQNITCRAQLNLEPHKLHMSSTAVPVPLSVYDFPADPELEPEIHLEVNETANVTCTIRSFFPEVHFALSLDGRPLPASVSEDGHRAVAELTVPRQGASKLLCTGHVGPKERKAQATVHVHSFPAPQLDVNMTSVSAGEEVVVQCELPTGHSPQLRLRLQPGAGHPLTHWSPSPLRWVRTAREEDDGLELTCEAVLPGTGKAPKASKSVRLAVAYGPRMDEAGCPPRQSWTEGQEAALRCSARGNPPPRVECARQGRPFPVGEPQPAARSHAGTYRCWATNRLGDVERVVEVLVECECCRSPVGCSRAGCAGAGCPKIPRPPRAAGCTADPGRAGRRGPRRGQLRHLLPQEEDPAVQAAGEAAAAGDAAHGRAPAGGEGSRFQRVGAGGPALAERSRRRGRCPLCGDRVTFGRGSGARQGHPAGLAFPQPPRARLEANTTDGRCRRGRGRGRQRRVMAGRWRRPASGPRWGTGPAPAPGVTSRPGAAMPRRGCAALPLTAMLLALFGRTAPGAAGSSFTVAVAGPSAVPYGEDALINCSTTCPPAAADGGLETSLAKGHQRQGPGWLAVQLHNITEPHVQLLCYFTCFGQRKTAALALAAYRFPDPRLAVLEPNASLHESVAVECSAAPSQPPGLQLWLRSSRGVQESGTEGRVRLELMAREEDDGLEFVCEAELAVGNQTLRKSSAPATLSISYGPRMDEAGCPPRQSWTEGQEAVLCCSARGNPPPRVECARQGRPFPVGEPQPAARSHAGTYRCWATNRLGDVERVVEVLVEYHDPPVLLAVLLTLAALAAVGLAGASYGIYYRKKKIRQYKLQEKQRQLEMQPMAGRSPEVKAAAPNGLAPAAQP